MWITLNHFAMRAYKMFIYLLTLFAISTEIFCLLCVCVVCISGCLCLWILYTLTAGIFTQSHTHTHIVIQSYSQSVSQSVSRSQSVPQSLILWPQKNIFTRHLLHVLVVADVVAVAPPCAPLRWHCCCYCHWFLAAWFVGNGQKQRQQQQSKRKRKCTDNWSTFLWHVGNISINSDWGKPQKTERERQREQDNNNNKIGCVLFVQRFTRCCCDDVLLNVSYVVSAYCRCFCFFCNFCIHECAKKYATNLSPCALFV